MGRIGSPQIDPTDTPIPTLSPLEPAAAPRHDTRARPRPIDSVYSSYVGIAIADSNRQHRDHLRSRTMPRIERPAGASPQRPMRQRGSEAGTPHWLVWTALLWHPNSRKIPSTTDREFALRARLRGGPGPG